MTPGWLLQVLAVIVGLVSCLWLDDVRAAETGKADVVLWNGKIYTADPARSIRQAIAIKGNTIVAVGDDDEVAPLIGAATTVVELKGKLVLPGLIDTHAHPIDGAINRTKCSLAKVRVKPPTIEALQPVIQDCLAERPGGADDWFEAVQLYNYGFKATAQDLDKIEDKIEEKRPLVLWGNDGHTAWVNSRGLDLLDITANTPDPSDGRIDRDASGAPTGLLVDGAVALVEDKFCPPTIEEQVSLTADVLKEMSADGITSLMDAFVGPTEEAVWRQLYRTGKLNMRVRMAISVEDPKDDSDETVRQLVETSKEDNVDPNFLRAGVVKVFADGVMEYPSQSAALLDPYLDADGKQTETLGKLYLDPEHPEHFANLVQKLDKAGLAVHIHAIGDHAVRASLDAFAAARTANGDKDNRHQIAHLQLVHPEDFPRFKQLGVIADMQLEWAQRDPSTEEALEPYLGPDRHHHLYPAGGLHAAGAMIIGGSDWDVSSYNPFCAFQTAVTRTGAKGQKPLNIDERIPLTTAVDAYTINAAFAMKQDATTGSIEVGKRADLVVLDRDIFSVDPDTIANTNVLATYLDGRLVYTAPANVQAKPCRE
jgi:predicted amidohydrolase YtcJ